jgi:hypothetical protein
VKTAITPETTLGALLEAYPDVEDRLMEWVPALTRLKNPFLRKTVAKVTTLEQAARMGGIAARDLVQRAREATGQGASEDPLRVLNNSAFTPARDQAPGWIEEDRVRYTLDADQMLATGEHPAGKIRAWGAALEPGQIMKLTASFRPAPLIDMMRRSGLEVHSVETAAGRFATYFRRL